MILAQVFLSNSFLVWSSGSNRKKGVLMFATHRTVLAVIRDGSRIDRYVAKGSDCLLYLTTKDERVPQVPIPSGLSTTKKQERAIASHILAEARGLEQAGL
jgi:hypothetical protein